MAFCNLFGYFSEKKRLDIARDLSARQTIHMKCHALFSMKNKENISKCHLRKFLPSMLSVKKTSSD